MKHNLRKLLVICLMASIVLACTRQKHRFIGRTTINPINTDLVIAHADSICNAFGVGIDAFGGFEKLNVKGKRILIKPTVCIPNNLQNRLSTNGELLTRIIEQLYDEKVRGVYVLENTVDDWRKSYRLSGVEKAAKLAYARVIPAFDENEFEKVELSDSVSYFSVHKMVTDCDLIINVAHLNINSNGRFEAGIVNLHGLTLEKSLLEDDNKGIESILEVCRPMLTIIDATEVQKPNGEKLALNLLIISPDPVAADAMAAKIVGLHADSIDYLKKATQKGFGKFSTDLNAIRFIEL